MLVGYVRVSSVEQNEERQFVTMEKFKVEKVYSEKISAKNTDRPKLKEMLEFVREGDTVVIHDFSRLARSTSDLLKLVESLNMRKIHLISAKENIDTNTPTGKLMLTMIGAINEFERTNLLERQREGIAIAKKNGKYKGGQRKRIPDFGTHYNRYLTRNVSKSELARELQISRPTLDKLIIEYKKKNA